MESLHNTLMQHVELCCDAFALEILTLTTLTPNGIGHTCDLIGLMRMPVVATKNKEPYPASALCIFPIYMTIVHILNLCHYYSTHIHKNAL